MKILAALRICGWITMGASLFFLLGFAEKEQKSLLCSGEKISLFPADEEVFISVKKIARILSGDSVLTKFRNMPVGDLNPGDMEFRLEENPYVRNAEVYIEIDGALKIDVFQRKPILRIFKQYSSGYYIDEEGRKMPLSQDYTAPVLLASGNIAENYGGGDSVESKTCHDLFLLASHIRKHEFWSQQISQIQVDEKGEFVLYPNVGSHRIILGDVKNLEDKFNRLWLFYNKALVKVGWDKYRVINLKYTGQIVCEK
jgi:cell division protein FtsQ